MIPVYKEAQNLDRNVSVYGCEATLTSALSALWEALERPGPPDRLTRVAAARQVNADSRPSELRLDGFMALEGGRLIPFGFFTLRRAIFEFLGDEMLRRSDMRFHGGARPVSVAGL